MIGSFTAYKVFEAYSPYEVRRKGVQSSNGGRPVEQSSSRSSRSRREPSSESEPEQRRAAPVMPLPIPTASAPQVAAPLQVGVDTEKDKRISDFEEKVKTLESEVTDAKAALDKERKEKAEFAVSNGKLKGQITQLSRASDKNATEVARLVTELTSLRAEKEKMVAEQELKKIGCAPTVPAEPEALAEAAAPAALEPEKPSAPEAPPA